MSQQPSVGRIVLVPMEPTSNNGAEVAPAIITRVWSPTCVNLRVIPDSPTSPFLRTSQTYAEELPLAADAPPSTWTWPPRV
jgi:hypothetical protein